MARILILCIILLFNELTIGTIVPQEDFIRVPRQLNFNGTECCPCPKNNSLNLGRSLSDGDRDNYPLIGQPDLEAVADSSYGTPSIVKVPAADCPCKGRKVGSYRNFLGKSRFSQSVEPDSLFNPEVNLASSILGSIHELNDQEYQEALARQAARSGSDNEDTNDEISEGGSVDINDNLGDSFNYAKNTNSDSTPVFIITVITDSDPISYERLTSDETASSNQETIVKMPILEQKPGNFLDSQQSRDKISNPFSDTIAKIVPSLPDPRSQEDKLENVIADTSGVEVNKVTYETTDLPLLSAVGTHILSNDSDQSSNLFSKQDTSYKEGDGSSSEQKTNLLTNPLAKDVLLTDIPTTNNKDSSSDLFTSNPSTKLFNTENVLVGDSQISFSNNTSKENFQDTQHQKIENKMNFDSSESKEVAPKINVFDDCEGACNEPIPSSALSNSTKINKSLLETVHDIIGNRPDIQKVLEESFEIPLKVLEKVSKGHTLLKESKLTSLPQRLSDELLTTISKNMLQRPEFPQRSSSKLGSRLKYIPSKDEAQRVTNFNTKKNSLNDQRSIKNQFLGRSPQQSLLRGKPTSESIERKQIPDRFNLRPSGKIIGMVSENADQNKMIDNIEVVRLRGSDKSESSFSDKTKITLKNAYKSQDNDAESINLKQKFKDIQKNSANQDIFATLKDQSKSNNRLGSVNYEKESETLLLKKTHSSDSLSPEQLELLYAVLNEKPRKVKIGETKVFNQPLKQLSVLGLARKPAETRNKIRGPVYSSQLAKDALSYKSPKVSDLMRVTLLDRPTQSNVILGQRTTLPNKLRTKPKAESENSRLDEMESNRNMKSIYGSINDDSQSSRQSLQQTRVSISADPTLMDRRNDRLFLSSEPNKGVTGLIGTLKTGRHDLTTSPINIESSTRKDFKILERIQSRKEKDKAASEPINNILSDRVFSLDGSTKTESQMLATKNPTKAEVSTRKGVTLLERLQTKRVKTKAMSASDNQEPLALDSSKVTITQEGPTFTQPLTVMTDLPSETIANPASSNKIKSLNVAAVNPINVGTGTQRRVKLIERIQTAREKVKNVPASSIQEPIAFDSSKNTLTQAGPAILQLADTLTDVTFNKEDSLSARTNNGSQDDTAIKLKKVEVSTQRGLKLLERIQTAREKAKNAPASSIQEPIALESSKDTLTQAGPAILQPADTMTDDTSIKVDSLSARTNTGSQDDTAIKLKKVEVSTQRGLKLLERIQTAREKAKNAPASSIQEPIALESSKDTLTQAGPAILQPADTMTDDISIKVDSLSARTNTGSQDDTAIKLKKVEVSTQKGVNLLERIQTAREKAKATPASSIQEPIALDSSKVTILQEEPYHSTFNTVSGHSGTEIISQDKTSKNTFKVEATTPKVVKLRERIQIIREKARSTSDSSEETVALDSSNNTLTQVGPAILQPAGTIPDITFNKVTGLIDGTETTSLDVTANKRNKVEVSTQGGKNLLKRIQTGREKAKEAQSSDSLQTEVIPGSKKDIPTQVGPPILQPAATLTDVTSNKVNSLKASTKTGSQDDTAKKLKKVEISTQGGLNLLERIQIARQKAKTAPETSIQEPIALVSSKNTLTQVGPAILQPADTMTDVTFNKVNSLSASTKTGSQDDTAIKLKKAEVSTQRGLKLLERMQTAREKAKNTPASSIQVPIALDYSRNTLTQAGPAILQPADTMTDDTSIKVNSLSASTKTGFQVDTAIKLKKVEVSTQGGLNLLERIQIAKDKAKTAPISSIQEPKALDSSRDTLTQAGPAILQPADTMTDDTSIKVNSLSTSTKTGSQENTATKLKKVEVSTQGGLNLLERIQIAREKAIKAPASSIQEPIALNSNKNTLTQVGPVILQPAGTMTDVTFNKVDSLSAGTNTGSQDDTTIKLKKVEVSTQRGLKLLERIQTAREKAKNAPASSIQEPIAPESSKDTLTQTGPAILQPADTLTDMTFNKVDSPSARTNTGSQDDTAIKLKKVEVSTQRGLKLLERIQTAREKAKNAPASSIQEPIALDSSIDTLTQAGPAILQPADTMTDNTFNQVNSPSTSTKTGFQDETAIKLKKVEVSTQGGLNLLERIQIARGKSKTAPAGSIQEPIALDSSKNTFNQAGPAILQPADSQTDVPFNKMDSLRARTNTGSQDDTAIKLKKVEVSTQRGLKLLERIQTAREKAKNAPASSIQEPIALESRKDTLTQAGPAILQPSDSLTDVTFNKVDSLSARTNTGSQDDTAIKLKKVEVSTQRGLKLLERIQTTREKAKNTPASSIQEPIALDSSRDTLTQAGPAILQPADTMTDDTSIKVNSLSASTKTGYQDDTAIKLKKVEVSTQGGLNLLERIQIARGKAKTAPASSIQEPIALNSNKNTPTQVGPAILQPAGTMTDVTFNKVDSLSAGTNTGSQDDTAIKLKKVEFSTQRGLKLLERIQTAREKAKNAPASSIQEPIAPESSKDTLTQTGPAILQPADTLTDMTFNKVDSPSARTNTGSQDDTAIKLKKVEVSTQRGLKLLERIKTAREKAKNAPASSIQEPIALEYRKDTLTQAGPAILQPADSQTDVPFNKMDSLRARTNTGSQDDTAIKLKKVEVSTQRGLKLLERIQTAREKAKIAPASSIQEPIALESSKDTLTQTGPAILQPADTLTDETFNKVDSLSARTNPGSQDDTAIKLKKVEVSTQRRLKLLERIQITRENAKNTPASSIQEPIALDSSRYTLTQAGPAILQPADTMTDDTSIKVNSLSASTKTGSQNDTAIKLKKVEVSTQRGLKLLERIQTAREKAKNAPVSSIQEPIALESSKDTLTQTGPAILQPADTLTDVTFNKVDSLSARTNTGSQDDTAIKLKKMEVSTQKGLKLLERIQTAREKAKNTPTSSIQEPIALDSSIDTLTQAGPAILQPADTMTDNTFNQVNSPSTSTKTGFQDETAIKLKKVEVSTQGGLNLLERIQIARGKSKTAPAGSIQEPIALDSSKNTFTQVGPAILQPADTMTDDSSIKVNSLSASTKTGSQNDTAIKLKEVEVSTQRGLKLLERIQTAREKAKNAPASSIQEPIALESRKDTLTQAGPAILQPADSQTDVPFNKMDSLRARTNTGSQDDTAIKLKKGEVSTQRGLKLLERIQTAREKAENAPASSIQEPIALESSKDTLTQTGPAILQPAGTMTDVTFNKVNSLSTSTKTGSQNDTAIKLKKVEVSTQRGLKLLERIQTAREKAKNGPVSSIQEPIALESSKDTLTQTGPAILQPADTLTDETFNKVDSLSARTNTGSQDDTAIKLKKVEVSTQRGLKLLERIQTTREKAKNAPASSIQEPIALESRKDTLTQTGPAILQPAGTMTDVTFNKDNSLSTSTKTGSQNDTAIKLKKVEVSTQRGLKLLERIQTAREKAKNAPVSSFQEPIALESSKDTLTQTGPAILQPADTLTDETFNKVDSLSARTNTGSQDDTAIKLKKVEVSTQRGLKLLERIQTTRKKAKNAPASSIQEPIALESRKDTLTQAGSAILQPADSQTDFPFNKVDSLSARTNTGSQDDTAIKLNKVEVSTQRGLKLLERIQTTREKAKNAPASSIQEPIALESRKDTLTQAGSAILQPADSQTDFPFNKVDSLSARTNTGSQDDTAIKLNKVEVSTQRGLKLLERIETTREKAKNAPESSIQEPIALDSSRDTLTQAGPAILQPADTMTDFPFNKVDSLSARTNTGSQDDTAIKLNKVEVSTQRGLKLLERIQTTREKAKNAPASSIQEPIALESRKDTLTQTGPAILQPAGTMTDVTFNKVNSLSTSTKTGSQNDTAIKLKKVEVSTQRGLKLLERIQTAREKAKNAPVSSIQEPIALESSKDTLTQTGPAILQPADTLTDETFNKVDSLSARTNTGSQDDTAIKLKKVEVSTQRGLKLLERIQTTRKKAKNAPASSIQEPIALESRKDTLTQAGSAILQPADSQTDFPFNKVDSLSARTNTGSQDDTAIKLNKVEVSTQRGLKLLERIQTTREKAKNAPASSIQEPIALESRKDTLTQAGSAILQPADSQTDFPFNKVDSLSARTNTGSQDDTAIKLNKVEVSTQRGLKLLERIETTREKAKNAPESSIQEPIALDSSRDTLTQAGPAILQPADTMTDNTFNQVNSLSASTKTGSQDDTAIKLKKVEVSTQGGLNLLERIQIARVKAKTAPISSIQEPIALDSSRDTLTQAGPAILQPADTMTDVTFNKVNSLSASTKTGSQDDTAINLKILEVSTQRRANLLERIQTAREKAKTEQASSIQEPIAVDSSKDTLTQVGPAIPQPANTMTDDTSNKVNILSANTKTGSQDDTAIKLKIVEVSTQRGANLLERIQTAREKAKTEQASSVQEPIALDSSKDTLTQVGPAIPQPANMITDDTFNQVNSLSASTRMDSQEDIAKNTKKIEVSTQRGLNLLERIQTAREKAKTAPASSNQEPIAFDSSKDTLTQVGPAIFEPADRMIDINSNKLTGLSASTNTESPDDTAKNPSKVEVSTHRGVNILERIQLSRETANVAQTSSILEPIALDSTKVAILQDKPYLLQPENVIPYITTITATSISSSKTKSQDETTINPIKVEVTTRRIVKLRERIHPGKDKARSSFSSQKFIAPDSGRNTLTQVGPARMQPVDMMIGIPSKIVTGLGASVKNKSQDLIAIKPIKFKVSTQRREKLPSSIADFESSTISLEPSKQKNATKHVSTFKEANIGASSKDLLIPNQADLSISTHNSLSDAGIESDSVPSDSKIVTQSVPEYILGISKNSDFCPQVIDPNCFNNDEKVMKEKKAYKCTMVCEEVQK